MSLTTGTGMELLYANTAVGVARSNFGTSEIILNDTATMGVQARLPDDFWLPGVQSIGRGIKIVARGIYSSNTTSPTFLFRVRVGGSQSISGAVVLGMLTAVSTAASSVNAGWELDGDVIMVAPGAAGGANSQVCGVGSFFSAASKANTTPAWKICYGGGASPGTVNIQTDTSQYINVTCTCSASAVANAVTLQQLLVFGLN